MRLLPAVMTVVTCCLLSIASGADAQTQASQSDNAPRFYQPAGDKKIVQYGWDLRDPLYVRDHIQEMERRPFDGIIMRCDNVKDADGKGFPTQVVINDVRFEKDYFSPHVQALKETNFSRFTDNFIITWGSCYKRTGARWFDDAFWDTVCNNMGVCAWVARQGGLKGLCFDAEPYLGVNTWGYKEQPDSNTYDFKTYYAKARQRGRSFMQAIQSNYPGLDILLFFGSFSNWPAMESPDVMAYLEDAHWGLYAGFLQGWLDVVEGDTRIHDGNELGYYYHGVADFDRARRKITAEVLQIFDPATWETYRQHVRCGSGHMIDFPPFDHDNHEDNFLTPHRFEQNLIWSIRASDKYTWVYNHTFNWWTDKENKPYPPDAYQAAVFNARFRTSRSGWTRDKWYGLTVKDISDTVSAPTIDGTVDDVAWKDAPHTTLATLPAVEQLTETMVHVACDNDALYLAWKCDGTAEVDDSREPPAVALCITDGRGTWPYYVFSVDINGVKTQRYRDLNDLDLPWQSKISRGDDAWTVEMMIPWKTLRMHKPDTHQPLRAQLLRYGDDHMVTHSWAPTRPGKIEFMHFGEWIIR